MFKTTSARRRLLAVAIAANIVGGAGGAVHLLARPLSLEGLLPAIPAGSVSPASTPSAPAAPPDRDALPAPAPTVLVPSPRVSLASMLQARSHGVRVAPPAVSPGPAVALGDGLESAQPTAPPLPPSSAPDADRGAPATAASEPAATGPASAPDAAASSTSSAPLPPSPAGPYRAPRTEPTTAQLRAAKEEIDRRTNFFKPTSHQVREAGDQVCSAFDDGYDYRQTKEAMMKAAARYPFLGVSEPDVEFFVGLAVDLFCPGYSFRLP